MSGSTGNKELQLSLKKRLVIAISLSVLFGLGWGIGLAGTQSLSVDFLRYSFQIIFILLTAFQGFFLFVAYGVRLRKVRLTWLKWLYIVSGQPDKASSVDVTGTFQQSSKGRQSPSFQRQYTLGDFENEVELKHFHLTKAPSSTSSLSSENGSAADSCSHEQLEQNEKEERECTLSCYSNTHTSLEGSSSCLHRDTSEVMVTDQTNSFTSQSSKNLSSSAEQDLQHSSPSPPNIVTNTTTPETKTTSDNHTELSEQLSEH